MKRADDSTSPTTGERGVPDRESADALPVAARRHDVVTMVAHRLWTTCAVPNGSRIALGVSGGADSTALLIACTVLRDRPGVAIEPHVVHVNHRLRDTADEEARWVAELCERLGVPCNVVEIDLSDSTGNLEADARRHRYDAVVGAARDVCASLVAVAHHADDQLETMLMALCRGSGLDGLSGMAWRRTLADGIDLIRPLLGTRRSACEDLCRAAGLRWREDPTNSDYTRARARLRRDVLPVLEELWPDAPRRASNTSDTVDVARGLLDREIEAMFGPATRTNWPRDSLQGEPVAMISAGLRRAALALGGPEIADDLIYRVVNPAAEVIHGSDRQRREYHWPGNLLLTVTSKVVELSKR